MTANNYLFLRHKGRVLYDALIYDITSSSSSAATPSFLIECDSRALQQAAPPHASTSTNGAISPSSLTSGRPLPAAGLMRHLKKYILSNNVLVENVSHEYSVYRIWPESPVNGGSGTVAAAADSELSIDKVRMQLNMVKTT